MIKLAKLELSLNVWISQLYEILDMILQCLQQQTSLNFEPPKWDFKFHIKTIFEVMQQHYKGISFRLN